MKIIFFQIISYLFLLSIVALAQRWEKEGIIWEIKMDKDTFLVDEYISFEVKIKNNSGDKIKIPDLVSNFFRYNNLHNVTKNTPVTCYGGEASYIGLPCFEMKSADDYYMCIPLFCGLSDNESYSTVPYLEPGKYELKLFFVLTCPDNEKKEKYIKHSLFFNIIEPNKEENNVRIKLLDLRKFSNINKESTLRGLLQLWNENPKSVCRPFIYEEISCFQMLFYKFWPNDIITFEELHNEAVNDYKNTKLFAYKLAKEELNFALSKEMKDVGLDHKTEQKKRKEIKQNASKMIDQKYPSTNFSKYAKSLSKYN